MDERARSSVTALADKYRVIVRMRAEASSVDAARARAQMAELAARFPGALRELDELPDAVIAARLAALDGALAAGEAERWMLLQAGYHGLMRACLRIRRLLRDHDGPMSVAALVAVGYVAAHDEPPAERLREPDLRVLLRPPGGRLNPWVFAQVAEEHGVSADEVRQSLFLR